MNAPANPSPDGRPPRVVIVGAGFGGLAVARGLAATRAEVVLVDRQNHHVFQPLLYQVATAGLSPADIAAPIRSIVKHQPRARVLLDVVTGVDPVARRVTLAGGAALDYDALVIATGARHSYFGHDDWAAYAPGVKTLDDATAVRRNVLLAMERAETMRQEHPADRAEYLTFVVIGGGPTGVEMAGAIAELTRHAAEMDFRFITRNCIRIFLVEAGDRLLPAFPPKLSARAKLSLEELGVMVRLNGLVTGIDADGVRIGDERIASAAVVWAAGVQASPASQWLGAEADRSGRVKVSPDLSAPGRPDIFVIGDTALVLDPSGRPVPGVAPAAKQQGAYVAALLKRRFAGQAEAPEPFRYKDFGALATIGRKRAVVDFGWLQLWGFPAWFLWLTAHIYFLVDFRSRIAVGANWLWNYLTFERSVRLITGLPAESVTVTKPR